MLPEGGLLDLQHWVLEAIEHRELDEMVEVLVALDHVDLRLLVEDDKGHQDHVQLEHGHNVQEDANALHRDMVVEHVATVTGHVVIVGVVIQVFIQKLLEELHDHEQEDEQAVLRVLLLQIDIKLEVLQLPLQEQEKEEKDEEEEDRSINCDLQVRKVNLVGQMRELKDDHCNSDDYFEEEGTNHDPLK